MITCVLHAQTAVAATVQVSYGIVTDCLPTIPGTLVVMTRQLERIETTCIRGEAYQMFTALQGRINAVKGAKCVGRTKGRSVGE